MAGDFVPWLIGLESGAKVVVGGDCPVPRDTLSDWARPGEGLRPLDNDETSWLLRVIRREFQDSVWTLIGFYDSGHEFKGGRPHAFVGAGVIARNLVVPGMVLDTLRTMVETWQQEIDRSGRTVEATALPVWSNGAVRSGLDRLEGGFLVSQPGAGLQPGTGSHFFHVSESDLDLLENAIRDLQGGDPFPAQSILFSSSLDLHRKAQELGYGTHSAESFQHWRAARTASLPEQENRTKRRLIDSLVEVGQTDPNGENPEKTISGLAFTSHETILSSAPGSVSALPGPTVPTPPADDGGDLRSAVLDLRGRLERLADEAQAATLAFSRLAEALEPRRQRGHAPFATRLPWRDILLAVIGGFVVLTGFVLLPRVFGTGREETPSKKVQAEAPPVAPASPQLSDFTSPVDFVLSYYSLLENDAGKALAFRGIAPSSSTGRRIVNSRRQNYQRYDVTDLEASEIRVSGNVLTSSVIGRIAAVTRAGEPVYGRVEVKIVADLPPGSAAPQWRIMSVREDPVAIRL